jgi:iron complex outermembrane receptor protein
MQHPQQWGKASFIIRIHRQGAALRIGWRFCLSFGVVLWSATTFAQISAEAGPQGATLEEVIVTARKVEENLQDIPMSVQVLTADFLGQVDIASFYELQFNIPGLVVNNQGLFGAGFALRGITDQGGTSQSVATHLNGVYLGDSNLALARMFDLERIEVLKGPQGMLYGRNSTAGSINFITRAPQDKFGAEVEAAYGSFDTIRVQGNLNLPFNKVAFRMAFIGSEGDGYIRNSVDDRTFGESDFWGLRASIWINATDKLLVDLMAQHVRDDGATGELWGPPPAFLPDPEDIRLTTVTLDNPYLVTESDNISLNIGYDLGFATLRSITGYAHNKVRDLDDCAGLPFLRGCVRSANPAIYDQWSQEVQLISQNSTPLSWLLGANYLNSESTIQFYNIVPLVNPLPLFNYSAASERTAYALFGQGTLQINEQWSITGGLRLSHEKDHESDIGTGTRDNPELTTVKGDWNHTSWRLSLEYATTADNLVYASVSTGYKSAGVTTTRLPDGEFDNFEPENLTAYELGMNSRWLDRRLTLNGAAFYYDFTDLQIGSTFFIDGVPVTDVENSAKAEIYGLDVSGNFQMTDRFTLSGGLVWLPKRELVDFVSEWTGDILSGNTIPRAPEWSSTTAIDYQFPLRDQGHFSVRLEYNFRSAYYFTKENDLLFAQDAFGLLNLFVSFEPSDRKWHVFAIGRNLTNTDYYNQVFIQSSPGYPAIYEVGFGISF